MGKMITKLNPGSLQSVPSVGTPLIIYSGGGNDEISTTATSFQGVKVTPTEIVSIAQEVVATLHMVVECKVTKGHELKARIMRTNEGSFPCLESTVVLTTNPKYEMHCHMGGFRLPPGEHEIYMEICVSGGTGYVRYRYFTVTLTT